MKKIILVFFILLRPLFSNVSTNLDLQPGDRIILGGDSITNSHLYSHYIMAWLQLTYPELDLETYELARSGSSIAGWATPDTTPPLGSSSGLYERYHYPFDPDVVFMMHGHNGGQTEVGHIADYKDLWDYWVDGVSSAKLVMLGMHPTQSETDNKHAEAKADAEAVFASGDPRRFASDTFEHLGAQWLANADNAIDIIQTGISPYSEDIRDAVHPGPTGHVAIAWAVLQGLGAEKLVSSAILDADTSTKITSANCLITNVSLTPSGGTFDRLDQKLPWALDETGRSNAVKLIPEIANWQNYSITIKNLFPGSYRIRCDGVLIGTATHAELSMGWNMSDLTTGPVWEQGQDVLEKIRNLQGHNAFGENLLDSDGTVTDYINRSVAIYQNGQERGDVYKSSMAPFVETLSSRMEIIHSAAQPVIRTYTIEPDITKAWSYTGVPYTDWTYDPFTIEAPAEPDEWPLEEKVGYYYIAPDDENATNLVDSNDTKDANNQRYGYPDRPRITLPMVGNNSTNIAPGSVFWIKGGTWNNHYSNFSSWQAKFNGTPENPIWIYGDPEDPPVFSDLRIQFGEMEDQYVIVDGIVWDAWTTKANSSVTVANGAHHITVRNCEVKNRTYVSNGSHFSVTGKDYDSHDIVFYKIDFHDNGHGSLWGVNDDDFHGIKADGNWGGGRAYRIWAIENVCRATSQDASNNNYWKSVNGTFFQVGDQNVSTGNVDHVFIAGNIVDYTRQVVVGCKRSADVIVSGNISTKNNQHDSNGGNAFNTKYDRQEYLWFIGNYVENWGGLFRRNVLTAGGAGGTDTETPDESRIYVIGNVAKNMTWNEQSGGIGEWKQQGITFHDMRGTVYVVNNSMDNTVYGVVTAQNSRIDEESNIHIYNNIFINMNATSDPNGGRGIMISSFNSIYGNLNVYIENNLMDDMNVYLSDFGTYTVPETLNALDYAAGNLEGSPLFSNVETNDYSLQSESPAVDAGTQNYATNPSLDVYRQFINRYTNDPDFPGKPEDVWPYDFNYSPRVEGDSIDIGAHEFKLISGGGDIIPSPPSNLKIIDN